jgi:hypothetical protein
MAADHPVRWPLFILAIPSPCQSVIVYAKHLALHSILRTSYQSGHSISMAMYFLSASEGAAAG